MFSIITTRNVHYDRAEIVSEDAGNVRVRYRKQARKGFWFDAEDTIKKSDIQYRRDYTS